MVKQLMMQGNGLAMGVVWQVFGHWIVEFGLALVYQFQEGYRGKLLGDRAHPKDLLG